MRNAENARESCRSGVASALIWLGRVVLVATTFTMGACAFTYPRWVLPGDRDWEWGSLLPNLAVAAILVFSTLAPLLVLPATSGALLTAKGDVVFAQAVMYRGSIHPSRARLVQVLIPGWTHDWRVTFAVSGPIHWLILIDSELWVDVGEPLVFESLLTDPPVRLSSAWGIALLLMWVGVALGLALFLAWIVLRVVP